jgi:hypothetical protein
MRNFQDWKKEQNIENHNEKKITQNDLVNVCLEYFGATLNGNMITRQEYLNQDLTESVETSRYSVEVNYRTNGKEVLEGFAKLVLGYVSAALKKYGYHTKHVFSEKPLRLLVSTRNWDDGENCGIVTWHPDHACFVISKGFYNKERKSVAIQKSQKCTGNSAAEITKELHNMVHYLKDQPDKHQDKLKPVPLKRGPKG